jgi:hypothetical protein
MILSGCFYKRRLLITKYGRAKAKNSTRRKIPQRVNGAPSLLGSVQQFFPIHKAQPHRQHITLLPRKRVTLSPITVPLLPSDRGIAKALPST